MSIKIDYNNGDQELLDSSKKIQFFDNEHLHKIELFWDNLSINAKIKISKKEYQEKLILKNIKGILRPGEFTAIIGPSGSGKTTLLNFLSARLASENLNIKGVLKVNNERVDNIQSIAGHVAYVQQDDILQTTFTPREAFRFAAKLRLNIAESEFEQRIEQLIDILGISKCADTMIGGGQMRGKLIFYYKVCLEAKEKEHLQEQNYQHSLV